MTVRIGIGTADLWGTWTTQKELVDECIAQALVAVDEDGTVSAVLGSDFCLMWPSVAIEIRNFVADQIGAASENVVVFATQNHAPPFLWPGQNCFGDFSAVKARFAEAARSALESAVPAAMKYVEAGVPTRIVSRRKTLDEYGAFTFWFGHDVLPDGSADVTGLVRASLSALKTDRTTLAKCPLEGARADSVELPGIPERLLLDEPTDSLAQAILFNDLDGNPIGNVTRWSAHPATATGIGGVMSGDYPVYIRRQMAHALGGTSMFLTGPCGNQVVPLKEKSIEQAESVGALVADALLSVADEFSWHRVSSVKALTRAVELPLRRDIPVDSDMSRQKWESAIDLFHKSRSQSRPMPQLKRFADRVEALGYWAEGDMESWTGVGFDDLASGSVTHPLFGLRLNDSIMLGLPGEPVSHYSHALREQHPGHRIIVCEEGNGYLAYIPCAEDIPNGGYEVCASMFDERVEGALLNAAGELVKDLSG